MSDEGGQERPSIFECVRKGFASASNYEKVRPDYPINAVKAFLQSLRLLGSVKTVRADRVKILELGSGTGKFTRVMLEVLKDEDVQVIASDPLGNMCEHFKRLLPDTEIIQCVAENIGLPDASVDVVIASQSFHYFANATALEEINRVLVPGGLFGIFWVMPDFSTPWMAELWKFFAPLYKEKSIILPFEEEWKNVFSLTPRKLFSDVEEDLSFSHTLPSSFDEDYNYFASASVIASGSESTKESLRELFNEVMKKHFKEKGIELDHFPFKIFLYWCTKAI
ncbi:hypothetical protein OS493_004021 [Desmophyllum pertusum]|uniref:Methyltransferase type 11 domain-containing protein n=1 Tax=Desmophyllum pertusum TaxID=174260 RepID=A0A9X0D4I8_9CNID|nr:hypothetical protein OS493_004021 [Desmophyllum pertusum]